MKFVPSELGVGDQTMVDRSLAQMRRVGLKYAAIPQLVWLAFCSWTQGSGSRTDWGLVCTEVADSGDEDVFVCLLDREHTGEHGFVHLVAKDAN